MTKTKWFLPALIITGLVFIGISLFISTQPTSLPVMNQKALGKAELGFGKVSIIRKDSNHKEVLTGRTSVYPFDSIEVGTDGDVTIETNSGYKLRIFENTSIMFDEENGKAIILVKRGDIQFETAGQEGTLLIARDGKRFTPGEYEAATKNQAPSDNLPDLSPSVMGPNEPTALEGLSPEQIQDTLRNNRSAFFRCYTQLLQKTPGITGQSSLSFTIEPSGKVGLTSIASSSIEDATFQKCLLDTLRRISFKSFSGKTISTIFPLKFE